MAQTKLFKASVLQIILAAAGSIYYDNENIVLSEFWNGFCLRNYNFMFVCRSKSNQKERLFYGCVFRYYLRYSNFVLHFIRV